MKKLYIIQKYVMAEKVMDAIEKSKTLPIHEAYVHPGWFEKADYKFIEGETSIDI